MIENQDVNITVEEVEGHKFRIVFTKTDLADAEDVLKNIEEFKKAIDEATLYLENIDKTTALNKSRIAEELEDNKKRLDFFKGHEQKARLYKLEEEKKAERNRKNDMAKSEGDNKQKTN